MIMMNPPQPNPSSWWFLIPDEIPLGKLSYQGICQVRDFFFEIGPPGAGAGDTPKGLADSPF